VGVAVIDVTSCHQLLLSQIRDNQSFSNTLALLETYAPAEIILSDSHSSRVMNRKIHERYAVGSTRVGA
jgi:hypothetical protein